jgi:CRISPR/Cas system-associated exonuclease Cas4 (RecB family)
MIAPAEPTHTPSEHARAPTESEFISDLQKTVSASRLNTFFQCRLKFWFKYVQCLEKPKTAALHVGGSVHSALKVWNKARWSGQPLTLKQLHEEYVKAWTDDTSAVDWKDTTEGEEKTTGWRLLETYIRQCPVNPQDKPEAVEVSVEADLGHHGLPKLIGILDLVQQGKIIDFKTSSSTPNPISVAHTNEVQSSTYAILYREATGKREAGIEFHSLVKLKNPKLVITALEPMTDAQRTRLFRIIDSYVNGLERRDWVPSPGLLCVGCEYFNECRRWY